MLSVCSHTNGSFRKFEKNKKRQRQRKIRDIFKKDGLWITFSLKIQMEDPCVLFAKKLLVLLKNIR